jgi:hypothetical protein
LIIQKISYRNNLLLTIHLSKSNIFKHFNSKYQEALRRCLENFQTWRYVVNSHNLGSISNYGIAHKGESMIEWYHKECHTFIFQDPSNFGKIYETHKEIFLVKPFVEYIN